MASASHTNQVPAASNRFSSAYVSFMDTGMEMAGTSSRFANLSFLSSLVSRDFVTTCMLFKVNSDTISGLCFLHRSIA